MFVIAGITGQKSRAFIQIIWRFDLDNLALRFEYVKPKKDLKLYNETIVNLSAKRVAKKYTFCTTIGEN